MFKVGHLYGVGIGPGAQDLITIRAADTIKKSQVVAWPQMTSNTSHAYNTAHPWIDPSALTITCPLPPAIENSNPYYKTIAANLGPHLAAGKKVSFLCEGDPLVYGSFIHVCRAVKTYIDEQGLTFDHSVIPGISAPLAAGPLLPDYLGLGLVEGSRPLTIIPAVRLESEQHRLEWRDNNSQTVVIIKIGHRLQSVCRIINEHHAMKYSYYIAHATTPQQVTQPLAKVVNDRAPYFSLIVVKP